ncbi:spore germination protein GerPE [Neobacillus sp. WH10]|uniref:spore germination protein GerPE n=1 Tax=Neobacillus sp. WH10 TaxID=3047873 RepID=UPI0024C1733D|nr:spore germination protein GerPE [Neobacillus sp. WH10]WHY78932.1 spore germination protein GerPE [Neobacillus sp. WH10]
MLTRTSNVDHLEVKLVSFSSVIQLGDSSIINGLSRALAVQREAEIFFGDEGNFPSYPIFTRPLPLSPITETMSFLQHNINPIIKVNNINAIAVSSSSILHVGNSRNVSMESRIKHIRQLRLEGHEQDIL